MKAFLQLFPFALIVTQCFSTPVDIEDHDEFEGIIYNESRWPFDKDLDKTGSEGKSRPLEDTTLFEGDLKIPFELYARYYLDEYEGNDTDYDAADFDDRVVMSKRGAVRDTSLLWPDGKVYYAYRSSVDTATRQRIREAMDYLEEETCLRFLYTSSWFKRKIKFQNKENKCYSNWIGKMPNWYFFTSQVINIGDDCETEGIILHEIGHGIGFWHEQSRPDRDNYVTILENNIQSDKKHNFIKRSNKEVNYHGTNYDYNSIMHYRANAFVKDNCPGCKAIIVNNQAEWQNQGSPTLGNRNNRFSETDILQVNRMYSCSMTGIMGKLEVTVRSAVNLPDTDSGGWWGSNNKPDVYVKVTAVYNSGNSKAGKKVMKSTIKVGTSVTWNQKLDFGVKEWIFIRIQVWDDDGLFKDDELTLSETVPLTAGHHTSQMHCKDPDDCNANLLYDYKLI